MLTVIRRRVLIGNVGVPVVSDAVASATTTVAGVSPDAAAVVASLRSKFVHCVDEQRNIQHRRTEAFARWFEQLVVTPAFVASVDRWT